jgi:hypothetical protein
LMHMLFFCSYSDFLPTPTPHDPTQSQNTTVEFRSAAAYRTAIGSNSRLQFNPQVRIVCLFCVNVCADASRWFFTRAPFDALYCRTSTDAP